MFLDLQFQLRLIHQPPPHTLHTGELKFELIKILCQYFVSFASSSLACGGDDESDDENDADVDATKLDS